MKKRFLVMALALTMALSVVACGSENGDSGNSNEVSQDKEQGENSTKVEQDAESNENENNDVVGKKATDLSMPVTKIDWDSDCTLVLCNNNGLYGIGRSSNAEFGIETEELSSMTLIAKDVIDVTGNIQYIDSLEDYYWSGVWYEGGVKNTFEKIDSGIRNVVSDSAGLSSVGVTTDNKLKFYYETGSNMSNLNEETVKEFEAADNVKYPLIGSSCSGYVTMDGDVYMKARKEATEKVLSGVNNYKPLCYFGDIYLLTDDGVLYIYGKNSDDDIVLSEIDSGVVSFSPKAYVKSNGEVYVYYQNWELLSTEMFPGTDISNVHEVLKYVNWGHLIYTTKDNKIVYAYYNDANQCEIKEYDCTLGGVQELFNDYNAK